MAKKSIKSLFESKTFWIAVVQAFIGIAVVVVTELDLVGYVAIVKSVGDIIIRLLTKDQVEIK